MSNVPQVRLKDFFSLFSPTYVLGTTYTVSLAFFEGLVYPEIDRTHLNRCLILCDKLGFQRATVEASALRSVGREYMAICAPSRHSFHPKVWIMIGDGRAAVLVGSGNLTQSGFMDNTELFDAVELEESGPNRQLALDLAAFISGLRTLWEGQEARRILGVETLESMQKELESLASKMPEEDRPDCRLLSNFNTPLISQFSDFFLGGTLNVAAPYFGGSTDGVELLKEELSPNRIRVYPAVHGGKCLDVSQEELTKFENVSVHPLGLGPKRVFAHLKAYGFDGEEDKWLFTTSANCTLAALGGDNVEAGLLRRVDSDVLAEYFVERSGASLPTDVRTEEFVDAEKWLHLCASDHGTRIEVICTAAVELPLQDVTLTLKVAGMSHSLHVDEMFANGRSEHIGWERFALAFDKSKSTALLSIDATSATGDVIRGSAVIENALLLTSDPTHRSAWRAALSLLESEGLPEAADLASVFHLVQDVFDADDEKAAERNKDVSRTAKSKSRIVIPDKVPIWPPVADEVFYGMVGGPSRLHDLQWFQKILTEFLNPKREKEESRVTTTADSMDEEVAADTKQVQVPPRVVKSVWSHAAKSFEKLKEQLSTLEVTKNSARKIWPVTTAVFVATLLTRRQLSQHDDSQVELPTTEELVRDFLRMLFIDRRQPDNTVVPPSCRYLGQTFPSLAEDLHETFAQDPSSDIASIVLLLFAYLQVVELRAERRIPTGAWLLLCDVAPDVAAGKDLDVETLRTAFEKYVLDEAEGITWADIESALSELTKQQWRDHSGYLELSSIVGRALGQESESDFPTHLEEHWAKTKQRIERELPWHYEVDTLSELCAADDCPGQVMRDPQKGRDLRRLAPTICHSCGAVLVPTRLWKAFEENHE